MGGEESPRRREVKISFSTPMASSTPSSSFNPTTRNPFTSSIDGKSVLLFDWWLIKAEPDSSGKGLAVGGLMTRGVRQQQATRVFSSAPIIKRYDAYTIETSDGITVRIQGLINRAHTLHTGVPPEVCNRFLIGFPYNWNYYADEYFGNKPSPTGIPTSASGVDVPLKHSSDNADRISPIQLDEFPMRRILDVITSTQDPMDLSAMKARLSGEIPSKKEMSESIQTHKNTIGYACAADNDAESHAAVYAEEAGCHRGDSNAGGVPTEKSAIEKTANFSHDISFVTSSEVNTECNSLQETGMGMQKEPLLEYVMDPEKNKNSVELSFADFDPAGYLPNGSERKLNDESTVSSSDLENKSVLNNLVRKKEKLLLLNIGWERGNYTLRSRTCLKKTNEVVSEDVEKRKEGGNSLTFKMNTSPETMLEPPETSATKTSQPEETMSTNEVEKSNRNSENSAEKGNYALRSRTCLRKTTENNVAVSEDLEKRKEGGISLTFKMNTSSETMLEPPEISATKTSQPEETMSTNEVDKSNRNSEYSAEKGNYALRSRTCLRKTSEHNFVVSEDLENRKEGGNSLTFMMNTSSETMLEPPETSATKVSQAEETMSTNEVDKSNGNCANGMEYDSNAEGQGRGNGAGFHRNDVHSDGCPIENSCINKTNKFSHNASIDSSLQLNGKYNSQAETGIVHPEKNNNSVDSLPVDSDPADHLVNYAPKNLNDNNTTNLFGTGNAPNDIMMKKENQSHLKHCRELGNYALRSRECLKKRSTHDIGVSEDLSVRKDSDIKGGSVNNLRTPTDRFSGISEESPSQAGGSFLKEPLPKLTAERKDGFAVLSNRLKNLKNKGKNYRTVKTVLEFENKVRSVTAGRNLENIFNDQDLGRVGVEKCTPVLSPKELDTKPHCESQACSPSTSAFSDEMQKHGGAHARDQDVLHDSNEIGAFKSLARSSATNASNSCVSENVYPSTDKVSGMIGMKITEEPNNQHEPEVLVEAQPTKGKAFKRTVGRKRGRTVWTPSFIHVPQTQTRDMAKKFSLASPESLNLRRSRSGRLLVPPISNWCQKIIYDADGAIIGITTGADMLNSPCAGSKSEPPRRKKKLQ